MDNVQQRVTSRLETKAADDPSLEDINQAFEAFMEESAETQKKMADELTEERKRIDRIEMKSQRPGVPGSAVNRETEEVELVETYHKAIGSIAKSVSDFGPADYSEMKAMSVGSDPNGGFLVPPTISSRMVKAIRDQSPMRRLCRVETISVGDAWEEPIDLDDIGSTWVGETEARPETSTPSVGLMRVELHEQHAMPKVTQRLLEDSPVNIGQWIEGKINDRFGRAEGAAAIRGDGIKKPRGFLTHKMGWADDFVRPWGTLQLVASGASTTLTAESIRAIVWKLRAPYRNGAAWLMNSNTAMQIDMFKHGNGNYLWRNGMTTGAPNTLLGYPVEFDETMPDVAAGSIPIAFGNFREGYLMVDRPGIRFRPDPYTQKPYVLMQAWRRSGGDVANFNAIKLLTVASDQSLLPPAA